MRRMVPDVEPVSYLYERGVRDGFHGRPYLNPEGRIGDYFDGWVEGRAKLLKSQQSPAKTSIPDDPLAESTKKAADWLNRYGSLVERERWLAKHPQREAIKTYLQRQVVHGQTQA